jgi:uncharacterized protein YndB with AHSA1/START domain
MIVAPVTKTLVLSCTPERAFAVFTEEIGTWWPIATHSVYGADATPYLDEQAIFEVSAGGERNEWGTVLVWEPPSRIVMTWGPSEDKSVLTEVEVRFSADPDGTRFELIHRGWERFGEKGEAFRGGYDEGWDTVLDRFSSSLAAPRRGRRSTS